MKQLISLVILLHVAAAGLLGQTLSEAMGDSIWLGTYLQLGMKQDEVLTKLNQLYRMSNVKTSDPSEENWFLSTKNGPPYNVEGSVIFQQGRLKRVNKSWDPDDQSKGVEFARNLYMAINGFVKEKRQDCWITTQDSETPKGEAKLVYLVCGEKHISFSILRMGSVAGYGPGEITTISETLGPPPPDVLLEKIVYDMKKKNSNPVQ